ncbi:cytoplasmic dynein 2 heavy chain 1 [Anoplophora glabripennis]|uniref:cytoplasmic dynein 2 heavy chain 1 n=1 Tax=Anoplophora glabripennis TaxID=217634 RepID=UPI000874633A|nr:cytoplasmic dynein 2 heavy chain 1 [Anoplophora glabripennis]
MVFHQSPSSSQMVRDLLDDQIVASLEHEVFYWETLTSTSKKDRITRTACTSFRDILAQIASDFSIIDGLPINDVEELLEKAHNILDDLWRHEPPYPKDRIKHIMDIIAADVGKFTIVHLKKYDVWSSDFNEVADLLLQHISLGEKWLNTCKQLTEIFWPNYGVNPWKEEIYQPKELIEFVELLKKILKVRTLHKQLVRLLTPQEQDELKTKHMFQPFIDIDIFYYGEDVQHSLLKAQKQFEYLIQPAERRVAIKLKKQLSSMNANTRQLIYEYSRYSELISRPVLKQELLSERQHLLTSMYDYIKQIQTQSTSENTISTRHGTPEVIKDIIMIRQLEAKASEIKNVSQKLLEDLQGFQNLNQIVLELIKELKDQHNELFEAWSSEIISFINDNTLSLRESDPVVQFSKQKLMKVNYSPRLVTLISEVRQLKAMGYHIPSVIEQTSDHAKKFMKYARLLEQIANFHNTIGDRMITSQKPMMLASALELSKHVQDQEVVSWGQEKSVEIYVESLKRAVEKLSKENNLLTTYHLQIMEKIRDLADVDLIKDYSKWKDNVKYIRNIMTQVEDKGFKNVHTWKNDLDKKLAEVLEKQYIESLDTLHLYLPEIHIDLVYRSSKLEYLPNEETLRKLYDQQLKKFLNIPKNFRGVSDVPENNIFEGIIERNSTILDNASKHTENLFEQLQAVMKHWQSWLQLEALDTNKLTTWQHWDLHFRASKTFGQEIAKLPSTEERVGCFLIGLSRLRSDLESHNRSYWDQLVFSLKDSIAQDIVKLQNYVDPSTAALTRQPVTMEEVGESGITHANILKQAPEMEETFNEMVKKSQILASWSREQVDAVNRLKGAWERLQSLLENHQHIIAKQMETIKTTLNIEKENLVKEIERFSAKWEQVKPRPHSGEIIDSSMINLHNQLLEIKEKRNEWSAIIEKKNKLISDYNKFSIDAPNLDVIEEIEADVIKEEQSWVIFEQFYTALEESTNEFWIVFRKKLYIFDDFLKSWHKKLNEMEISPLVTRILHEIHKYQGIAPLLKYVRGEDFSEKHWLDTFNLLGMEVKPVDQLVLKDFLAVSDKIESATKDLQTISKKAASEIVVRQALAELDQWDVQARFVLNPHKDSRDKDILLVKDFKEVLNKIGDNQSLLQSVKNSADYESFAEKANIWENKLGDLDHYLTSLAQVQRKWVYLEPIFGSGTLSQEKSRFDRIDRDFRHILNFVEKDLRVAALCRYPNLRSLLESLLDQLSRCQNSLDNFLKEKREKFPRFLFLSDDDLLEVIGQSSKEQVIQSHMKKIFAGIHSVRLDQNGHNIIAMCSLQGEVVELVNYVAIQKPVEEWLNSLVKEMQVTLKELLVNCQREKQAPDPLKYPSQILCLSDSITFTTKCEQAISSMTIPPMLAKYKAQLNHYSSLEINGSGDGPENSDNTLELKLKALLLDTIHHINVLEELLENNVTKVSDWVWQKQLRYYTNSTGEVTIKMANARMEYSYEYLGNAPKLVRTPLTDRCFLVLTQGIYLGMGGNPYGPAGTGKTESVKALGGLLGRQVLVFNCDEGIDAASMGRILTGIVRSGAWGCFDEFNRLDEATLSAVSMLIHPIQVSLRTNKNNVVLLDQEVTVNKHCGIFVTLNPAGGGYGGRNKLPDNLKQLFRPVVMTHPDHEQIARSLFHCDGYQNADLLAKKLIEVFDLSSKLLSKQQHYDWGLRSIRTILSGCGRALKKFKINSEYTPGGMDLNKEAGIVIQVLRMDTLSKLTFADGVKFDSIIRDVFKNVKLELIHNDLLLDSIGKSFEDLGLIKNERQINKCLEFYEQLQQRMGVAIVGPPSSGKSTVRNLMFHALTKINKTMKSYAFNPKSMTRYQLLGKTDPDTNQWNDGVLTNCSLQVAAESSDVWSWIVCDGDVDPDWVESLNSVLDDNRLLSLPSGWRIQFGPNVNFVFETHDLSYASPATISRMGIIFLSEEDLDLNTYITNFVQKLREEQSSVLEPLISDYFKKALNWVMNDGELTIPSSKVSVAKTGLSQLNEVDSKAHFCVGLINGLGQQLQYDFREIFAQQVYEWTGEVSPPLVLKSRFNKERCLIESYYTNPNTIIENISEGLPLVETGQISQYLDSLRIWLTENNQQHFLLVGPHGSAKTLILKQLINERSDVECVTIHCSTNLMPIFVIGKLAEHCIAVNTHRGKIFKPKKGYLTLHFKNLDLLKCDKWGTNILIEFLNQLVKYKGFYDAGVEFIGIENITIVGSLATSRNLSKRFTSNMHVFNINTPEHDDFSTIISAYLSAILRECFTNQTWPKAKVVKLTASMISIFDKVRNQFTPTKRKHYNFSPHDLTNWCKGLLRYQNNENIELEAFIIEVVAYEAVNIFGDKLADDHDRKRLYEIINETLQSQWSGAKCVRKLVENYYFVPTDASSTRLKSCKLTKLTTEEWRSMVQLGISQYEREGQVIDIIINDELLHLTASISKTLSCPRGNILLVGKSGVGRKSAIKIVSALQSAKLITPENDEQQFNNDLKAAIQYAGLDGENVYILLEDHHLAKEQNLNKINLLISSGEIPGLYSSAELESLIKILKDEYDREDFDGTLLQYFSERIKKQLHVTICLDVRNENLSNIIETCPSLSQNSSILWKPDWSINTIAEIPKMLLERSNNEDQWKTKCSGYFSKIYQNFKTDVSTPSRFISMIRLYESIYDEKLAAIEKNRDKLKAGVMKLTEAENLVKELKQNATVQQNKLEEKQSKANSALDMISNTMRNANSHKEEMESLKSKTESENIQLIRRKREIEEELSQVEPLIQEARSAVGNIKAESLSEIRSLRAPPDVIRDILEGVLRLMGIQDTSWNSMKTFLAKRGVKEDIRSFDASRILTENRQAVEKLMSVKSESFDARAAKRASVAAAPLAAWVAANVKYSQVVDKIRPLEREQNKLKQNLTDAETQLGELSAGLLNVDATVAKLKEQLSSYTKEAAEIEIGLNKAQETLAAAEGLVSKLTDEYKRWQDQVKELSKEIEKLPNNCLMASAFISFLSNESEDKRIEVMDLWSKEIGLEQMNIESFLSTEREQLQWLGEGLSSDKLSIQNAIMILKADMVPLLIDPTSSATEWIKQHLKHKNIECVTQNSPKFKNMLELAVRFGKTFIIEEVDSVCPSLLPILRKEFVQQGERKLIKLNGKLVDHHSEFKLILCSRNEQVKLPADVASLINLLNFTVTHAGLTEQLLSRAIQQENPELENRKKQLLREKEELEEKQSIFQNQLLEDLANSQGDILKDTKLLASLNETKASSEAISVALKESSDIQDKLQEEYNAYRDVSLFGSSLYFACNDFAKCNILYLVSALAFSKLFLKSLQTFQGLENNLELQKKHLLDIVYQYISRGIFKNDRLKFLLHLVHKLYPKEIPDIEWTLFMGNIVADKNINEDIPPWIPKQCVLNVKNLQYALPDLYNSLQLKEFNLWKNFMNSSTCESEIPSHCHLGGFKKVVVIQALRPDRLYSAISHCVLQITGLKTLEPSVLNLSQIYKESNCEEPVLLLAMSGSDPSSEITDLAENLFGKDQYMEVAMGEGQEPKAIKALQKCADSGSWLILKNLHLVTYWLPILSQNLKNLKAHEKFRLWLISEATPNFSFVLAQNSLKVVYEAPRGLKNNILRTYFTYGSKFIEKLNPNAARIFFVISCVHALLQERRKYIPQGWSKYYDFSDTDFYTCIRLVEDLWNTQTPQIQWRFISGLCSDAVYGGRIENVDDMKIVESYTNQYFKDAVLSHRWKPFHFNVNLPTTAQFQDYLNIIKQFPTQDEPSIFGLAENINRAWEIQTSSNITTDLKNLYLSINLSANNSQEYLQKGLIPFMNLWKKINHGHDFVRITVPSMDNSNSAVEIFLNEEFKYGVLLIQTIHKQFSVLNKACKGIVLPSEKDLSVGHSLLNYETPNIWSDIWNGPKEPNKYLSTIMNKVIQLEKWKNGNINELLRSPLNLSYLFHPEALIASHKQDFSRTVDISMDQLTLKTSWKAANQSIILSELLVEGGLFENGILKPCSPNSENINNAPNCYLNWIDKKHFLEEDNQCTVPLYTSSNREKKVVLLQVPCEVKDKEKWIQAGLALYLEY